MGESERVINKTAREPYHERQSLWFCGQHTLNNLLQGDVFTREQLENIALKLAKQGGLTWRSYIFNPHKSIFGVGNYDINVLEKALMNENLEVQWFDVRKDIRSVIQFTDETLFGLILNVPTLRFYLWTSYHWIAIKPFFIDNKLTGVYNLDSKLSRAEKFENVEEVYKFLESVVYQNGNILLVKKMGKILNNGF
ncbi:Machado-joseph disease protein MJD [Rhizophagus diaphanus]|nr:Machado-joseph disease protein MJD [Rhizophagus diaphanus] [Rhizophagus sp. MUCL 43196]